MSITTKSGGTAATGTDASAPLEDFSIKDLDSFNRVTRKPYQIAGLYFYKVLDCLIDLAYRVSEDFFRRPHLYLDLKGLAPTLAKLYAQLGSHEELPDKEQRNIVYAPIFGCPQGAENAGENFPRLKEQLVQAAAAFSERVFDTGEEMLRERVRTTHRPFKEYLTGLNGDSVEWSKDKSLVVLTERFCYPILRNEGVASVFGISKPPSGIWPYDFDSNGEKLVAEISAKLASSDDPKARITREGFTSLQRTALKGAEAIATIIEFDESKYPTVADLDLLIKKCYTWGAALLSLKAYPNASEVMQDEKRRGGIALAQPMLATSNRRFYE